MTWIVVSLAAGEQRFSKIDGRFSERSLGSQHYTRRVDPEDESRRKAGLDVTPN